MAQASGFMVLGEDECGKNSGLQQEYRNVVIGCFEPASERWKAIIP